MTMDYMNIGSSPYGEDCAQTGSEGYFEKAIKEMASYKNQLRRHCGMEPKGARIVNKSFPHDFGTYHEIVCYYEEGNQEALDYALKCEGEGPEFWDDIAKKELGI